MTTTVQRQAHFDHLRILLTFLVVLHHAAITYGGSGGWYWRELPNASVTPLIMLNAIDQSFFMGFFFLLSGYFMVASLERKTTANFLIDRFMRLGIPLLVYFFVLSPLTIALAHNAPATLGEKWWMMIKDQQFAPGPLWFAEALLIFAALYLAINKIIAVKHWSPERLPGFAALLLVALGLGIISFAVRLKVPVGEDVLWLQLGFFPCYVFLFFAGCAAHKHQLLDKVDGKYAAPWLLISLVAVATLPFALMKLLGDGPFEGGWNANAIYYAFWDPLTGWGIILGLLWFFRRFLAVPGLLSAWIARRVYGVFIFHAPILVAYSVMFAPLTLSPYGKFIMVSLLTFLSGLLVTSLCLLFPPAKKIL